MEVTIKKPERLGSGGSQKTGEGLSAICILAQEDPSHKREVLAKIYSLLLDTRVEVSHASTPEAGYE